MSTPPSEVPGTTQSSLPPEHLLGLLTRSMVKTHPSSPWKPGEELTWKSDSTDHFHRMLGLLEQCGQRQEWHICSWHWDHYIFLPPNKTFQKSVKESRALAHDQNGWVFTIRYRREHEDPVTTHVLLWAHIVPTCQQSWRGLKYTQLISWRWWQPDSDYSWYLVGASVTWAVFALNSSGVGAETPRKFPWNRVRICPLRR